MFKRLQTLEELNPYFDDFCAGARIMLRKTREKGQNINGLLSILFYDVTHVEGFVLIHLDEANKLDAFMLATHILSSNIVEFIGMWTKPGVGATFHKEGNEIFEKWVIDRGAYRVLAGLQRSPEKF